MNQDTILHDECVVRPGEWPDKGLEGARLVDIEGKSAAFLPDQGVTRVPFPQSSRPVGTYNQIVLDLYFPGTVQLIIVLETGHLSPGFDTPDELHTVPGLPRPGWWKVSLPLASFLPIGLSSDFSRVNAIRFQFREQSEPVALGEMRLQVVEHARGPRLTDEEFLDELNLERQELIAVKAARATGDTGGALLAADDHFRTRRTPKHFFLQAIPKATNETIRTADQICDHWVNGHHFPGEIDWRANPTGYQEWPTQVYYMSWTVPLQSAYLATRDEKYAQRLDEIISSFVRYNPRPLDHSGGGGPWGPHRPSARATRCWPYTFYATLASTSFQWRTRVDMLKSWWEMTEHSLRWSWPGGANPRMSDSRAIAMAGILLPEFRRAAHWREEGLERLHGDMNEQVRPDGVHYEAAGGYHAGCLAKLCEIYGLAKLNSAPLAPGYEQTIHRMIDWLVHLTRPCGTRIAHNDSGGFHGHPGPFPESIRLAAQQLGRSDVPFVAGENGTPPADISRAFPGSGFYLMRSGWDRDGLCLFFDGGILGKGHYHEDKLGIDLSAFGREFIVDPGVHSYMVDRFTKYLRSSHAHSTIHVDGKAQNRRAAETPEQRIRDVSSENEWHTGPVFDYASSQYDAGYGELPGIRTDGITHRRAVVFVRNDYFLVFDLVDGKGPHTIESMLHFAPMPVLVDKEAATFHTRTSGEANLDVICLPGLPTPRLSVSCGETDPPRGWVAPGWGPAFPAPVATMAWDRELPLMAGMLLIPSKTGVPVQLQIRELIADADTWAGRVLWPDGRRDVILMRFSGGNEVEADGVRTDARMAVARYGADGALVAADRHGGTKLDVHALPERTGHSGAGA